MALLDLARSGAAAAPRGATADAHAAAALLSTSRQLALQQAAAAELLAPLDALRRAEASLRESLDSLQRARGTRQRALDCQPHGSDEKPFGVADSLLSSHAMAHGSLITAGEGVGGQEVYEAGGEGSVASEAAGAAVMVTAAPRMTLLPTPAECAAVAEAERELLRGQLLAEEEALLEHVQVRRALSGAERWVKLAGPTAVHECLGPDGL